MAPASVFDKAHRQLSCHAGASIIITDAWEISPHAVRMSGNVFTLPETSLYSDLTRGIPQDGQS